MNPVVISQFLSLFVCYSGFRLLEARKTFVAILEYSINEDQKGPSVGLNDLS